MDKENDKHEDADSFTIRVVVPNVCTNFEILGAVVPVKSLTQISLCITRVRDGKKGKRSQKKFQHCGFLLHKILQPSVGVYRI